MRKANDNSSRQNACTIVKKDFEKISELLILGSCPRILSMVRDVARFLIRLYCCFFLEAEICKPSRRRGTMNRRVVRFTTALHLF